MGKFLATHKYFIVFLALVAFHDSHQTHGRKTRKPLNTNIAGPERNNHPHPTLPSSKNVVVAGFGDSAADANAFRPTTPGSSPGVGHRKFAGEDTGAKATAAAAVLQSPDVKVTVTDASKNDFQPTDPGHSPGVGHAYPNKGNAQRGN